MDQRAIDLVNAKVVSEMPHDKKEIGIAEILAITEAIVNLIQSCKNAKKERLLAEFHDPSFVNRFRLRRAIRKLCKNSHKETDFDEIMKACLKGGQKTTIADLDTLLRVTSEVGS